MDARLIANFGNRIRAETFDDFLDHADAYRESGERQAAGVLAYLGRLGQVERGKWLISFERTLEGLHYAGDDGAI
jgi:hypothetical protein